ncbi:copper resistance protein B [Sphingorhabdus pulchriflava]|uniref:Copper resistance protein B n=1 Tax=Sphingorhabdus pulchriflava TaxID=2292257 RepID=A0A371B2A9_9SPHN|nr:copper resistance protein B [Sphingorhabdus pulchriflava]RDV01725.1 copper resistance protein B [Sphingorhabdus pulchriflava]
MRHFLLVTTALLISSPALAQHEGHGAPPVAAPAPTPEPKPADPHAGHDMSAMDQPAATDVPQPAPAPSDPHAGHDMSAMPEVSGTEIGNAPAPAPPEDHAADSLFDPAEMARSRDTLRREHGVFNGSMILFDLAEYQARKGGDGYRWEAEAWFGGDIDRFMVKTEGEGTFGEPIDDAEVQLLYSRAVAPYWNAHVGVRHDFRPDPSRTYAVVGIEGVAPYWFHLSGQLFLSDKGDFRARAEGSYDQRITQSLILSPRAEFNLSAQDMPAIGVGSGLTDVELGLRLRYEVRKEFAPYVGVEWSRKVGDTARYASAAGEDASVVNFVAGIRFWF